MRRGNDLLSVAEDMSHLRIANGVRPRDLVARGEIEEVSASPRTGDSPSPYRTLCRIVARTQVLESDLTGPDFWHDKHDKIVLESKEDMLERDLARPDHGDSLALTFAAPVVSKLRAGHTNVGSGSPVGKASARADGMDALMTIKDRAQFRPAPLCQPPPQFHNTVCGRRCRVIGCSCSESQIQKFWLQT